MIDETTIQEGKHYLYRGLGYEVREVQDACRVVIYKIDGRRTIEYNFSACIEHRFYTGDCSSEEKASEEAQSIIDWMIERGFRHDHNEV